MPFLNGRTSDGAPGGFLCGGAAQEHEVLFCIQQYCLLFNNVRPFLAGAMAIVHRALAALYAPFDTDVSQWPNIGRRARRVSVWRRGAGTSGDLTRYQLGCDCVISWGEITYQCYQLLSAAQLITTDNSGPEGVLLGGSCIYIYIYIYIYIPGPGGFLFGGVAQEHEVGPNPQPSTLNPQPSTLNTQHSTLNTQP